MATNWSSKRTDEIVQREINNATHAVANRSDAINVGKMMKISLPKYIRGESIDTFLKFLQKFLVYLINYNLMKPEVNAHRVSLSILRSGHRTSTITLTGPNWHRSWLSQMGQCVVTVMAGLQNWNNCK
jgi:hypothetical protein